MEKPVNENFIAALERLGQRRGAMNNIDANMIKNGTIEDWIVANEKTCSGEEQKKETAKELLDDTRCILREMENHVAMISDAVYRGERPVETGPALTNEPCATPPMVVMMREQRGTADRLLKEIVKIREALW